ncbi:MAG: hypothetical protein M3Q46_01205 [Verrucomicrobiota bacterium]|nr:hypothetical protein [Verrucomicrobiota bacterium]
MTRHLVALATLLLALPGALLAMPKDPVITALYARGLAGDAAAVNECIAALENVLAAQPDDQVARVYLGSAYTLRSRDLPIGPAKLSALRKGIALMDEAAAAGPGNADVLLNRAVTTQALPGFLGRRKIARQQLEQLVVLVEKDPPSLSAADRQLLYLNAGEAARAAGDRKRATELWQRGLMIAGDAKLTAEIKAALAQR